MTLALLLRMLPKLPEESPVSSRPIAGGVQQRSFLIDADGARYVLRLPARGAPPLLDVAAEARVMQAAAAAGIAPAVAAFDADSQALLTVYLEGARPWHASDARNPENITRACALLRRLHALTVDAPAFTALEIARSYAEQSAGDEQRAAELRLLAARHDAVYPRSALCHNDLVAANVLDDGALHLVDFEYAVRGAPILDLASLAAMNGFRAAEQAALLAGYCTGEAPVYSLQELEEAVRMVRLMAFFWARLRAHSAANPAPYARLAAQIREQL